MDTSKTRANRRPRKRFLLAGGTSALAIAALVAPAIGSATQAQAADAAARRRGRDPGRIRGRRVRGRRMGSGREGERVLTHGGAETCGREGESFLWICERRSWNRMTCG